LYVSRGALGVIVITTKKGKKGATNFTFRSQLGFTQPPNATNFDMMNTQEIFAYEEKLGLMGQGMAGPGWVYSKKNPAYNVHIPAQFPTLGAQQARYDFLRDSLGGINSNWSDILFRQGFSQNYELNLSGGGDNTRFFVSIIGSNGCETEKRGINARFGKSAPGINPLPANGPPFNALQSIPSSLPAGVTRAWTKNNTQIGTGGVIGLTGDGTYKLCFTNACGDSCITYVVTSVASQLSGLDFRIFPNPTSGNLNLGISGENKEPISLEVKDLLGKGLFYKTFNRKEDSEKVNLETAGLSPGIYFLNIRMKSGQKTIRFVKQ
jgi:hypothetical protein